MSKVATGQPTAAELRGIVIKMKNTIFQSFNHKNHPDL